MEVLYDAARTAGGEVNKAGFVRVMMATTNFKLRRWTTVRVIVLVIVVRSLRVLAACRAGLR